MRLRTKEPIEVKLWSVKIRSPSEGGGREKLLSGNVKRKWRRKRAREDLFFELPRMSKEQKRVWKKAGSIRQEQMQSAAIHRTHRESDFPKRKQHYQRELLRILDREVRAGKIKSAVRNQEREAYAQSEREAQTKRQIKTSVVAATRVMGHPLRRMIKQVSLEIQETSMKYAAFLAVPVLMVFFLLQVFVSAVSCISGNEAAIYGAAGEEVVAYARQWVGVTKYVLGAGRENPTDWQDYTDCSGFVRGVFLHFGYTLGSYTGTQQNDGVLVEINSLEDAMPGDIVLFYKNGQVDPKNHEHVGIYAGDGQMIHCAGGSANRTIETAGIGVVWGTVKGDGRPWMVRRIISGEAASIGSDGYQKDQASYNQTDMELIWAIVAQEDNGSYEGALAVISSAMNRTESAQWSYLGNNALSQLTAPGQYCYSNDDYWRERLDGNVPAYVKQAVNDCLNKGIRNHQFTSFRSKKGSQTGNNAVQIGGNWYFGS